MNRELINKLAEDDAKWRNIAFSFTKDYEEVQEVVQERY